MGGGGGTSEDGRAPAWGQSRAGALTSGPAPGRSCWAFAASQTLSDRFAIKSNLTNTYIVEDLTGGGVHIQPGPFDATFNWQFMKKKIYM